MNKKVMRQFVEQFGKDWECSCKEPFKIANLEIISESENSLIAQYVCPNCAREQLLSASISEEKQMLEEEIQTIVINQLTSDDVLDIRQEFKHMKLSSLRGIYRGKLRRSKENAERFTSSSEKLKS